MPRVMQLFAILRHPKTWVIVDLVRATGMWTQERLRRILEIVIWTVLFGLAYAQSPLYTSNQNQYFLHGIANSGYGFLRQDWLANTVDPTPLFSLIVQVVFSYTHPFLFYVIYFVLFGIYLYCLYSIVSTISNIDDSRAARWLFLTSMILLHSVAFRWLVGRAVGGDWQYLFDGGVAGQRLLGTVLQPSSFGVLLLLSIQQFLEDRPYRAVIAAVLAAWVHPTYLLSAGALTISYMLIEFNESREIGRSLRVVMLAGILTLPVLYYVYNNFFPTAPDVAQILAEFRIPEHAQPSYWADSATVFKSILVLLAIYLTRKSRLFWIMLSSLIVLLTLTFIQVMTHSDNLALLFPWRLSTYLVPLSTAILLGWLLSEITGRHRSWFQHHEARILVVSMFITGLLVIAGTTRFAIDLQNKRERVETAALAYAQDNLDASQVYFIPPKLQDFRLETGVPIFIDFKSIPYNNLEVRSWYERLRKAQFFYQGRGDCGILYNVAEEYSITHVLLGPKQVHLDCEHWDQLFLDENYAIYRVILP